MEIKRRSWHYKISNLWGFEGIHDNLCKYFWRLVGKSVLLFVGLLVIGLLVYDYFTSPFIISTTILVLFIFSIASLPPLTIHYIRKKVGKSLEIPGENIFFEYLKARKRQICPLIKYIN